MADTKVSGLTALAGANVIPGADVLPIVDTSATQTKKILVDELAIALGLNGLITGLVPSQDTDTDHDTLISAGTAMDATGAKLMRLGTAITKRIDASWAVGDDQGGLDTGSVTTSTWYFLWLIMRSDTGVVDVLYSASSSAPTMPSSYDYKRLIGAVRTDGSANIVAYKSYELAGGGLEVLWDSPTLDVDLSNTLTTSRRTDVVKVPTGIEVIAHMNIRARDGSAGYRVYITSPDVADIAPSDTAAPLYTFPEISATSSGGKFAIRTNTSAQIAARATLATVDSYQVVTLGWEWSRR